MAKLDLNNLTRKQALLLLPLIFGGFIAALVLLEAFNADKSSSSTQPTATATPQSSPTTTPVDVEQCWKSGPCIKNQDDVADKAFQQVQEYVKDPAFAPELQSYFAYVSNERPLADAQCRTAPDLINPSCVYLVTIAVGAEQTSLVLADYKKQPYGHNLEDNTTKWIENVRRQADAQKALIESDKEMGNVKANFPLRIQLLSEVDAWVRRTDALLAVHADINAWLAMKNADIHLSKLRLITQK